MFGVSTARALARLSAVFALLAAGPALAASFRLIDSDLAPTPVITHPPGSMSPAYEGHGRATAVSPDGNTVVGFTNVTGGTSRRAWSWTAGGGIVPLAFGGAGPSSVTNTEARAVNSSGHSVGVRGSFPQNGMAWPSGTVHYGGGPSEEGFLNDVSEGGVSVGQARGIFGLPGIYPDGGPVRGFTYLGSLSPHQINGWDPPGEAKAISHDGQVIVGWSMKRLTPDGTITLREAFRWTEGGGMAGLGTLTGRNQSGATDVSSDGSVIVGHSYSTLDDREAFIWRSGPNTMTGLGDLPGGGFHSEATAVSGDGSVVIGLSGDVPFIWDAGNGMRSLASVLEGQGVDLIGWTLQGASGISADGTTIVGWAANPGGEVRPFIATLTVPEPGLMLMPAALAGVLPRRRRG